MLRSCGIPCQIVYSDTETLEGTVYRAWNLVWAVGEDGGGKWRRYDAMVGFGPIDPLAAADSVGLRGRPVYGEPKEIW